MSVESRMSACLGISNGKIALTLLNHSVPVKKGASIELSRTRVELPLEQAELLAQGIVDYIAVVRAKEINPEPLVP